MTEYNNIPFNKAAKSPNELKYISDVLEQRPTSGNGHYTKLCHQTFADKYGFDSCLLTTSCTDALEMCALLLDISDGDEVIMPSYTFVSTANAFALQGAKIVFADSLSTSPNVDPKSIKDNITKRTKAIVIVHYAGFACDMDAIISLCREYDIPLIEDAAHAVDSKYKGQFLGTFGDLACFSFHETKNISCGEGGLLVINNEQLRQKAEIIWEKGTDRSLFKKGLVNKYQWVSLGSSFLPSEITAAYLYAQLEIIDDIQAKRVAIWKRYYDLLSAARLAHVQLPDIPEHTTINGHIFYLVFDDTVTRDKVISALAKEKILAVFHYVSLHRSAYYTDRYGDTGKLTNTDRYTDGLLRLPLYYSLELHDVDRICSIIVSTLS